MIRVGPCGKGPTFFKTEAMPGFKLKKQFPARAWSAVVLLCMVSTIFAAGKANDPFDYNFCGGERVYPIVGVEFSTICGPRNMVALGRRGKIMWFFPSADGKMKTSKKGQYKLNDMQLLRLSMLAEVTQVSPPAKPVAARVQYKLGVNFSGRAFSEVHTGLTGNYLPSSQLFKAMLELVPDQPDLPDCSGSLQVFDPIKTRIEREQLHKVSRNE
ncbi:MAG: hypothetical protein LJE56_11305 [Acidiferrobacterales bacterium]|nr:hypothetical protein [Acidiferrobacterales bacterium]